jgi:hypothetical protein
MISAFGGVCLMYEYDDSIAWRIGLGIGQAILTSTLGGLGNSILQSIDKHSMHPY